jgi:asparagine synthase (glutamine-hydrolysing)
MPTGFGSDWRQRLLARQANGHLVAEHIWETRVPRSIDLLYRATRMDLENYLAEDILVKVDRASMLNSLEVRAPLLDYRMIEFAFGLVPPIQKATVDGRKILLKKLAARLLPAEFDQHRKQGFSIPLATWLCTGVWRNFFRDVLLNSEGQLFDHRAVSGLLKLQERGLKNSERLFALTLLELWRQEYRFTI